MSITAFSNQACPVCSPDADVLHYMMKCRSCGHVNETPTEQRQRAMSRHIVLSNRIPAKERFKRRQALNEARAAKARESNRTFKHVGERAQDRPVFGSGRQRTKV